MRVLIARARRADFRSWFIAAVLLGAPLVALSSWLLAVPPAPTVVVYGDSLTVQSEGAARRLHRGVREHLVFEARGGTAMCDWVGRASYDRAALHPQRVVLAFTGNIATCVRAAFLSGGVPATVAVYERSLREMRAVFPRELVTVLIPPAMRNLPTGFFPFNGNPALVAMYKRVGAELHMAVNTDADDWLTPHHVFEQRRPAYPNGPLVDVRLSDGIHLTPAGELWYGAALLAK